jgi:hypothetical protein
MFPHSDIEDRCVHTLFSRSTHCRSYDIFARQKLNALVASHHAVPELCERFGNLSDAGAFTATEEEEEEARRLIFYEMTEIAFWGNTTDLSLLSSLSLDQIHSFQGKNAILEGHARIVSNDIQRLWDTPSTCLAVTKN